jgi:CRISPR/Cas system Type II protein with McrA/HNH and RuvC-like nuclease domain
MVVLTDGRYFITENENERTFKTQNIEEAKTYNSCNSAMMKKFECRKKCRGFYPFDTEDSTYDISSYFGKHCNRSEKRKTYTKDEKLLVYNKANGCCQLCGKKLKFNSATLDHIIPLIRGGADDVSNLQLTCSSCNQFKGDLYTEEYLKKIEEIYFFQLEWMHGRSLKWKLLHGLIGKMI